MGDGRRQSHPEENRMPRKKSVTAPLGQGMRPMPPDSLFLPDNRFQHFVPAAELAKWVHDTFLREGAVLANEDHKHLLDADIGYLWARNPNQRQMRRVVGECELVMFRDSGWQRARKQQQFEEWFGRIPEFLITLDAGYARKCSDLAWCALVEHELYHVGQRSNEYGEPLFTKDGYPKLGIRRHDVEEFVGIVRRYGVAAGAGETAAFVAAANRSPEIGQLSISHACGTCMLRAA